ncbi:hypothetical protein [Streptomyces sp. NBC_01334]|uniref:hypothetical protein n=1 Tax=Streptomyces sp. NBC_01334 TaxID=2903827 RepID=UPI002E15C2A5|nr:hypothetical protein OG736_44695 [Streptomyces sp. NBC_01334]
MSALDVWLNVVVPILVTGLLARAVWAALAVEASAQWLLSAAVRRRPAEDGEAPWLVVLLPMLREQAVAAQSIAAFTGLDYPTGRAAVAVITTEREHTTRAQHRRRLPELAALPTLTASRLRGLFHAARCPAVADTVNTAPPDERLAVLAERFDAEPSTADIVTALTTGPTSGLPLVHLHQPDVGGRKPGQLNFALDCLRDVLGPLGWREDAHAHDTFILVYDADAVPGAATLTAFADAAVAHQTRTGRVPALIQQQRLPLLIRRPFPRGMAGLLLAEEWVYQLRRSLGIELARVRLHRWLTYSRLPEPVRMWLRPMVYAVGCGMAVHLPALRRLGGFPEPMEDVCTGHRLSLLGADFAPSTALVLDEPYTDAAGLTNLHALAFTSSARPDLHARGVAHLPSALPRLARAALILREWADEAAWLVGAPLLTAAVASSWCAAPLWAGLAAAGVLLHGPITTARLLALAPALHHSVIPPAATEPPPRTARAHPIALVAASPLQPFVRLAGPWRLIWAKATGRRLSFGKTER